MTLYAPEAPGLYPRELHTRTVGYRLWATTRPHWLVDAKGRRWLFPEAFHCDLVSNIRALWIVRPPAISPTDYGGLAHDFWRRCHKLLGLDVREIDLEMFPAALRMAGGNKTLAWIKAAAVWGAWNVGWWRCKGDGWYGTETRPDSRFDRDVLGDDGLPVPLATWVKTHYKPDGQGGQP